MGVTIAGCFADYAVAPAEFTWAVPDSISEPDAAAIELLAVAVHAVLQPGARMGDAVAVVGCGAVRCLAAVDTCRWTLCNPSRGPDFTYQDIDLRFHRGRCGRLEVTAGTP